MNNEIHEQLSSAAGLCAAELRPGQMTAFVFDTGAGVAYLVTIRRACPRYFDWTFEEAPADLALEALQAVRRAAPLHGFDWIDTPNPDTPTEQ